MLTKKFLFAGIFCLLFISNTFSQADLVITSQNVSPLSVTAGNYVSATCYIYNQGTSFASSSNVGYYLSTDAVWDAGDTYINYYSGASLAASSSAYKSLSLLIPASTAPGNYYILFYADYSNAVAESNETNNVSSVAITVVASVVDLVITNQTASPTTVAAGNSISASCYIYNQGTSSAASSNVGYYLSTDAVWDAGDTYLNYSAGAALGASSSSYRSSTLTIPGATAPGSYYIIYYADYSNAVTESVETNNEAAVSIIVQAPVIDLIIQSQTASPTTVAAGYSVTATCYIYNQGNSVASSSNVGYYLSTDAIWDAGDTYLSFTSGGTLNANTSSYRTATLTIPGATTPGTYYILFYADYSNAVTESVETNNVLAFSINVVTPLVDLIIQSQSTTPITIASGSTTSASCYIYNQGNVAVSSSNVGYYLSTDAVWDAGDTYLNYSSGGSLAASTSSYRSSTLTIPGATAPGSYYLLFYADYSNAVTENVETNNVNYIAINVVAPFTDLIIQSQSASPVTVAAGNTTSASCYIFNQGNISASSSNVGYYLSTDAIWDAGDTYLNYSSGSALAANSSASRSSVLTIPGATAPGNYYILFYADYSNAVTESVETNNVAYVPITVVTPTVDLIIQSQGVSPTSVVAGNSISATCYIYNQGNASANASNVGYYLSTDATWDAGDTYLNYYSGGTLAAATSAYKSITLTIPGSTTPGTYYILFYADYSNVVSESIETNNVAASLITVTTPTIDLIIQSQSASPTSVTAGNNVSVSCYIYNQGNAMAASSNVGYYLSTDAIWDPADTYLNYSSGGSLAASTSSYRSATLTIPIATTPGNYYILYFVDYSNVVSESVETNNVASVAIIVSVPNIDLIIQSPAVSTSTVIAGNSVTGSCYIYNQGNTAASSSNVGYYLSTDAIWDAADVFLTSSAGGTLAATSSSYRSATLTIPGATTPGNYYILFFADYSNLVSEGTETNNVSSVPIVVQTAMIDLIIQTPAVTPTSVSAGGNVTASCYIYNQGNSVASASSVGYYLSTDAIWDAADTYLNSSAGGSLAASTSAYRSSGITIPASTPNGSYYIIFFADYSNVVSESVETNNYASMPITVTPFVNIITMPLSGSNTYTVCSGTVYDDGGASANYSNSVNSTTTLYPASVGNKMRLVFNSFTVETCCDFLQIYDGTSTAAPLLGTFITNPGTITATNASGALTLRFYSDGSVSYAGFDASISCQSAGALPDLSAIYLTCSPMNIPQAATATVTCSVLNSGGSSAGANVFALYLSSDTIWDAADVFLDDSAIASIAASASATVNKSITIPLATTVGNYYLLFVVDTANSVSENIETNNVSWLHITVSSFVGGISSASYDANISIFPNPSHGDVNFIFVSSSSKTAPIAIGVRIFDYIGKLTDEFTTDVVPKSETKIIHHLNERGVYLAEIKIGEAVLYRRIIIQ